MRPLLVGEDNPYSRDPKFALYPYPERSAGYRLCAEIMGLNRAAYLRSFDRVNLCADKWSLREARARASALTGECVCGHDLLGYHHHANFGDERCAAADCGCPQFSRKHAILVLLGKKVCDAFRLPFEPFTTTSPFESLRYAILPHPSGRSMLWNIAGSIKRARDLLREAGALPAVTPLADASDSLPTERTPWPTTECTTERPARCSNCGVRVDGEDCPECGIRGTRGLA